MQLSPPHKPMPVPTNHSSHSSTAKEAVPFHNQAMLVRSVASLVGLDSTVDLPSPKSTTVGGAADCSCWVDTEAAVALVPAGVDTATDELPPPELHEDAVTRPLLLSEQLRGSALGPEL